MVDAKSWEKTFKKASLQRINLQEHSNWKLIKQKSMGLANS